MSVKTINIRTAANGSYTYTRAFKGQILGVELELGDLSTPDIDITDSAHTKTFLSVDGVAASTVWNLGAALLASTGSAIDADPDTAAVGAFAPPICMGTLVVAVTGAGASKRGKIHILYQS